MGFCNNRVYGHWLRAQSVGVGVQDLWFGTYEVGLRRRTSFICFTRGFKMLECEILFWSEQGLPPPNLLTFFATLEPILEFWDNHLKSRLRLDHVSVHKAHSARVIQMTTTSMTHLLTRIVFFFIFFSLFRCENAAKNIHPGRRGSTATAPTHAGLTVKTRNPFGPEPSNSLTLNFKPCTPQSKLQTPNAFNPIPLTQALQT